MSCYAWELACLYAYTETDNTRVLSRIAAARSIITERLMESVPLSKEEWVKIGMALDALESLEKAKIPIHQRN
jgi:hypothetical protein